MYSVVFQIREQRWKIKINIKERIFKVLYEIGRKASCKNLFSKVLSLI